MNTGPRNSAGCANSHQINVYADLGAMSAGAKDHYYYACWGDYDGAEDGPTPTGHGATPEAAVRDLIDNQDSPDA